MLIPLNYITQNETCKFVTRFLSLELHLGIAGRFGGSWIPKIHKRKGVRSETHESYDKQDKIIKIIIFHVIIN